MPLLYQGLACFDSLTLCTGFEIWELDAFALVAGTIFGNAEYRLAQLSRLVSHFPQHGYPSEQIVRLSIQNQEYDNLIRSRPQLLLVKLLTAKLEPTQSPKQRSSSG